MTIASARTKCVRNISHARDHAFNHGTMIFEIGAFEHFPTT
jgi:hypothetical protein